MLDFKTTSFFDSKKVKKRIDWAKKKNFSTMGRYIRKRARTSIKRRVRKSPAGGPPHAHAKSGNLASLKAIFWFYDFAKETLAVGPVIFNSRTTDRPGGNVHEFGGHVRKKTKSGKHVRANYPKRPFMGPALDAEIADGIVPKVWKDSIHE